MTMPFRPPAVTIREADPHDPATAARIAAFVNAHPDATPFHLPAWGLATSRGCGQRFTYLVAETTELVGVLPISDIRSRLFGRAFVSTGFGVGGGVLATHPAAERALTDALVALAKQSSFPTIELRGGALPEGTGWTIDDTRYLGFVRQLAANDAAELLAIPRKQRAEVRKALSNDLDISVGRDRAAMDGFFTVFATSVRNLGTPVFPRRLFEEVLTGFGPDADILTVRHAGRAVASVLSLYWRGTVYPYWGGGTVEARALRANDAMYFALMRHAREREMERFDFGRSKAGSGPAAFKRNWGFAGTPLAYPTWTADGAAPRDASPLNPKYRLKIAAWQRLPLPVANRIGPWIARGLG